MTFVVFTFDADIGRVDKPDPRQEVGGAVIDSLSGDTTNIGYGMPASRVDLGWLSSKLQGYIDENEPGRVEVRTHLLNEIPRVVQRIKMLNLNWIDYEVRVSFITKDDYDSYHYEVGAVFRHLIHAHVPLEKECLRDNAMSLRWQAMELRRDAERLIADRSEVIAKAREASSAVESLCQEYGSEDW